MSETEIKKNNGINPDLYVNEFIIRGVIDSLTRDKYGNRVLTVGIQSRRGEIHPQIMVDPSVKNLRYFGRKDRVLVRGYIRAFSYLNDTTGKNTYLMFVTATELQKERPELARRFDREGNFGHFYPESLQRIFVSGKVVEVKPPLKGWAELTIATRGGGSDLRPCSVRVRYYTRGALPFFDYQVGDIVATRLSLWVKEWPNKEHQGQLHHSQSLTVEDIDFLHKAFRREQVQIKPDIDAGLPDIDVSADTQPETLDTGAQAAPEASAKPAASVQQMEATDVDLYSNLTFDDDDI